MRAVGRPAARRALGSGPDTRRRSPDIGYHHDPTGETVWNARPAHWAVFPADPPEAAASEVRHETAPSWPRKGTADPIFLDETIPNYVWDSPAPLVRCRAAQRGVKNIRAACPPRRLQKSGRPDTAAQTSLIITSVRFKASHALPPPPGTSKPCSVTPSLAAAPPAGRGAPNQRLSALPHMRADLWTSLEDHPRPRRGCFGLFFELGFG